MAIGRPISADTRWYPSKQDFPEERQWNALRQAFDKLYELEDHVQRQRGELTALQASHQARMAKNAKGVSMPNTVSSTHLNGIRIKGVPPEDAQTLKYNAKTGEAEWTT